MGKLTSKVVIVAVCCLLSLSSLASAIDVCDQGLVMIDGEPAPVDIACATGDVYFFSGTGNLQPGGSVGTLGVFGDSTVNIYGGTIGSTEYGTADYGLNVMATAFATVYAATAEVDAATVTDGQSATANDIDQLEITDSYIKNTGPSFILFDLVGTYQDQTPFVIPCNLDPDAVLSLNIPQARPEIDVLPASLVWNLGEVEVGQSTTMLVQIYNSGNANLNVSSVTLTGDAGFSITAGPATPLTIAPPLTIATSTSIGADFEITFAPTAEGTAIAVVEILSDDSDEPAVQVSITAAGIVTEIPPAQQIQNIIDFLEASVELGAIQGYGPGNSPQKRLNALNNMLESAGDLIEVGDITNAVDQLNSIAKKTDGISKPQDFVVGEATAELNAMVQALIADLTM